ncbi:MAG: tetratricopeptide repeat protein [Desulfobacterales bacterium]|nr:tetratricopeptide repeat protein [Desulfobacterales bacterium]
MLKAIALAYSSSQYPESARENDYLDIAEIYFNDKQYETAIEYFNYVLKINPRNDVALFKLSQSYLAIGNYEEARRFIERALAQAPKNDEYVYFKNQVYFATKNRAEEKPRGSKNRQLL